MGGHMRSIPFLEFSLWVLTGAMAHGEDSNHSVASWIYSGSGQSVGGIRAAEFVRRDHYPIDRTYVRILVSLQEVYCQEFLGQDRASTYNTDDFEGIRKLIEPIQLIYKTTRPLSDPHQYCEAEDSPVTEKLVWLTLPVTAPQDSPDTTPRGYFAMYQDREFDGEKRVYKVFFRVKVNRAKKRVSYKRVAYEVHHAGGLKFEH